MGVDETRRRYTGWPTTTNCLQIFLVKGAAHVDQSLSIWSSDRTCPYGIPFFQSLDLCRIPDQLSNRHIFLCVRHYFSQGKKNESANIAIGGRRIILYAELSSLQKTLSPVGLCGSKVRGRESETQLSSVCCSNWLLLKTKKTTGKKNHKRLWRNLNFRRRYTDYLSK